ncbi:hypothetical protein [Streptomyces sp. NBC_01262]|uniref:hypothetical protein n=1 Tax=Streptomyces sp. NBC_01262 TaxID=2903803 RepID=UPI002E327A1A|nr:hypothetical protein [Streptomyces sp. NBC_01262]
MRASIEKRVSELEAEYREGQRMLAELEAKQADLRQTVLRISGALQVLNELLATEGDPVTDGAERAPAAASQEAHE